tara:strand:+ start:119 stop:334 length:216 start_codon:yes stop_codon:yes gene_type:complete
MEPKYYFITYLGILKGETEDHNKIYWNQVIDTSPMKFIEDMNNNDQYYRDFVIINTHEITLEEFNKWENEY